MVYSWQCQIEYERNHRGHKVIKKFSLCPPKHIHLEIKAIEGTNKIFEAQVLTYLKGMDKRAGLLINFNVLRIKESLMRAQRNDREYFLTP